MKVLPWILAVFLAIVCLLAWLRPHKPSSVEVIRDTVTVIDTVRDTFPKPMYVAIIDSYPMPVPIYMPGETIYQTVYVPISQSVYETKQYKAWISGYHAKLDSINVYQKTQTIYEREKVRRKPWGLAIQVGYGYPNGVYVGGGISYNLFQW